MVEILAPAGDMVTAKAALRAGADAVYLGLSRFSARDGATNFNAEELKETVRFAHLLGAKVYVCLNTLVKDSETAQFFGAAAEAYNAGADAVLVQDLFLGGELKKRYPEIELHLSTQAGCCNVYGAGLAKEYGFSRVVLARETALDDIERISKVIETEAFVQGALCACFSGQCYFSSFAGGNSGNRGRCKQPCRKRYSVDRKGYEDYAYALSPSDLSLGSDISELIARGVQSLKIEGRMRRPEYVAAAVSYYRALLTGQSAEIEFSRMARAYNRGDYTEGIAFGERNFLSRDVQGHIGQQVGEVSFVGGKPFCKSVYRAQAGDGFKILRGKKEAGGARCVSSREGGFFLEADFRLIAGDCVRVTTDTAGNLKALEGGRLRPLNITVRLVAGELPAIICEGFTYRGEEEIAAAQRAPLTKEEIAANFKKTDGLPFAPEITVITDNAFLAKSALNALRRAFYAALCDYLAPAREPLIPCEHRVTVAPVRGTLTAALTAQPTQADIDIFKTLSLPEKRGGARYVYLPPFFTGADENKYRAAIESSDGVYCDGYYGLALAKKYQKPLFAGTGFNLCNAYAVEGVKRAGAKYFALSKELSAAEQRALSAEGAFALTAGDIKLMDLAFCPFSRDCKSCDRRDFYTLTDESGRKFPLRRYGERGACRFELFNCLPLSADNGLSSALVDLSVCGEKALAVHARDPQAVLPACTGGHKNRSML